MSDVQIKVDIVPSIDSAAIQAAVNNAAKGINLKIDSIQFPNLTNAKMPNLAKSASGVMRKYAAEIGPLESRLKKLQTLGVKGPNFADLNSSVKTLRTNIKGLSSATKADFAKMAGAIDKEMKRVQGIISRSEQSMRSNLTAQSMKTVNSVYSSLTGKMGKTGMTAKQAKLDAAYKSAQQATEKAVEAKISGNASAYAAASASAKKAQQDFLALGREIEKDNTAVQQLQRTLASLQSKHTLLGEDPNADKAKLKEMEAQIQEVNGCLNQMGTASSSSFDQLKTRAETAASSAGKLGREIAKGAKDVTSDMRPIISMLEKIQKLETGNPNIMSSPFGSRIASLKKELEDIYKLGITTKTKKADLQNQTAGLVYDAGKLGYSTGGTGGGATSRIASLFKNVTGAMIFYSAFYKAKEAAHAMYESVVSVDDAMTQLKIVTGASGNEMNTFFKEAAASATELGHSVSDVLGSIETFSRLGYNLKDALNLSEAATVMSNVAAVGVDASTTGLTSIIKGYGLGADQSMEVADKLTLVGQNYAVSASELMEALERGGSSLASANNSLDESIALIAAGN